jgi:hypothetical protein
MNRMEKRSPSEDRRIEDVGPPDGWRDRRRRVERRIPRPEEVEVSDEEWAAYFANPAKKATHEEHEHAVAADVFERARK